MTEQIKEKIKEFIAVLPKENQEVVGSFGWEKTSEEIGKKHLLVEDEINGLQLEIGLVLTGIVDPILLPLNIENEVGTSKIEAESMANEVLEQIFNPIVKNLEQKAKIIMKDKSIHWRQNLDFILSGGDYTAFIRRVENETKDELPKPNETFNPSRLDDLKSKFTI